MKKEATTISLDDCPLYDGAVPLYKTLEATKDVINAVDDEVVLEQFFVLLKERKRNAKRKDSNNSVITLENILKLKVGGFTNKDIADLFKVRPSRIHNMIVRNRGMLSELLERCFGDDVACIPSL
jgi:DNA-directed RNA polymerase specialized sigma24 family protein